MYNIPLILLFLYSSTQLYDANLLTKVDSLQTEIAKNQDDPTLHYKLGRAYYALEQYENALESFTKVLLLNNQYPGAVRMLARIHGCLGDYHQMLHICEEHAARREETYLSRELGVASAMLGNNLDAINYYEQELKIRPYVRRYPVEVELAMLFRQIGNDDEAVRLLEQAVEGLEEALHYSRWKDELVASYRSLYLYRLGYFKEADSVVEELAKKGRADPIDLFNQAIYKLAAGDSNGLVCLREVLDRDTTSLIHTIYKAIIELKADSVHRAEAILKSDVTALRNSGMAKGLLAWTLERIGKDAEARKYWFMCYGKLPLGTDVASMREFMNGFIETVKSQE